MPKKKLPSLVQLAASIYGCDVSDLLAHHEFEDRSVAIIAPTGQKFTYSADQLLKQTNNLTQTTPQAVTPKSAAKGLNPLPTQSETLLDISADMDAPASQKRSARDTKTAKEP